MAIKKSDLYSSLWASCDELRGGMDASQYKDYVLFMLFIKYVSDKYGNSDDFAPPVTIPKGASFKNMVALKGDSSSCVPNYFHSDLPPDQPGVCVPPLLLVLSLRAGGFRERVAGPRDCYVAGPCCNESAIVR